MREREKRQSEREKRQWRREKRQWERETRQWRREKMQWRREKRQWEIEKRKWRREKRQMKDREEAMCSYVSYLRTPPSLFWLDLNSQPLRYEEDTLHSGLIHGGSAITVYIIYILYRLHDGNENTRIQNCIATVNALIYTQISLMFIYRKCGSLVYC